MYLQSTINQHRLGGLAICHVYMSILDSLVMQEVTSEFINFNDYRWMI